MSLGNSDFGQLAGDAGFILWRSVYVVKQVSSRTRLLVLFDYVKTKLFGRDVSSL